MRILFALLILLNSFLCSPICNSVYAAVDFESALNKAIKSNENYTEAVNLFHNSKIDLLRSKADFIPTLNFSSSWNKTSTHYEDISEDRNRLLGFNLNYNVFKFGSDYQNFKANKSLVESFEDNLEAIKISLERAAATALLALIRDRENINILKKIYDLKVKALDLANRRYKAGFLSKQDYQKVLIDVNNSEAELLGAKISLEDDLKNVRKLLGDIDLKQQWPWINAIKDKRFEKIYNEKFDLKKIPDWNSINSRTEYFDRQVQGNKLNYFGRFDLRLDRQRNTSRVFNTDGWQWSLALTYTLPLFDGFDIYSTKEKNLSSFYTNKARLLQKSREAFSNFENSRNAFTLSYKTYHQRLKTRDLSNDLYKNSLLLFNRGQLSVNEMFTDQTRLLRTEQLANAGTFNVHLAYLNLCHSLGKRIYQNCLK